MKRFIVCTTAILVLSLGVVWPLNEASAGRFGVRGNGGGVRYYYGNRGWNGYRSHRSYYRAPYRYNHGYYGRPYGYRNYYRPYAYGYAPYGSYY